MDSELEELESMYSVHFGWTSGATPSASQNDDDNNADNDEDSNDGSDMESANVDRAQAYMNGAGDVEDGGAIDDDSDEDRVKIQKFLMEGCGCNNICSTMLTVDRIHEHVLNVREMSKDERDMYIMGVIVNGGDTGRAMLGRKRKQKTVFTFSGSTVCKSMFMVAFDVGRKALSNIIDHVSKYGATPRTHGNTGRKPKHAIKFVDVQRVVTFINNYADEFGMPQPAAPRGRDNIPPIYLTCQTTKLQVHSEYVRSCTGAGDRSVKTTAFYAIWKSCCAHIKIASPRDDVCATCERLRKAQMDSVTEEEKLATSDRMGEHVRLAQAEREVYNDCIKRAKETRDRDQQTRYNHYTFDYSQNVSIPHHARQMGPVYFTSLRKVQLFGFRDDGIPQQLNFLLDEQETMGQDGSKTHGPNAVISMVDHGLNRYADAGTACALHADNCPGQNKNQYMMGYLMWRVMTGQHSEIEYHMQVPGHARCLVDSGFGNIKTLYRRSDCETIDQLTRVVDLSASTNTTARYPEWQWRDWKSFLSRIFKPFPGIRKYQYFKFTAAAPGDVIVRTKAGGEETTVRLLKNPAYRFPDATRPPVVDAPGLSEARQSYLFKSVRPFVRPAYQDITCPALYTFLSLARTNAEV